MILPKTMRQAFRAGRRQASHLICPSGQILVFRRDDERRHVKKSTARRARFGVIAAVESHSKKFCCSAPTQITSITAAVSSHTRGVSRSSRTRDEMRWTQQCWACDASAGRIALRERLAACKTTALLADGEVVWS